jgi:hypothetical protein
MKLFVFYNPSTKELITVVEETSALASQWIEDNALNGAEGFYLTASSYLNQGSSSFTSINTFDQFNN